MLSDLNGFIGSKFSQLENDRQQFFKHITDCQIFAPNMH